MDFHRAELVYHLAMRLKVVAIFGFGGPAGRVLVSAPDDDRMWSSDHSDPGRHVVAVIEEEVAKPDNRRKLIVSADTNSHLFIWVDEDNYLPWRDILDGHLPDRPPALPTEITTVWVATSVAGTVLYWFCRAGFGWRSGNL
jgi:hypothetical protein